MDGLSPRLAAALRVALYAALAAGALFLPMTLEDRLETLEPHPEPSSPPGDLAAYEAAKTARASRTLLLGMAAAGAMMAAAWWFRFAGAWDAVGVLGAWTVAFTGYATQPPTVWLVLPAFLVPWALLFVELAPRHRIVLLLMQWLTSIKFLETLTATTASTVAVAALGALHLVLVWVSLRGSALGRVPLVVGALMGGVGAAVALWFLAVEPTPKRVLALLPPLALLLAVGLLAKGRLLANARLPALLARRPAEPQAQ